MPGGFLAASIRFWMHPQIPPDVAALHGLRFWVRGNAVQMRGKQAFEVWQYTFITGQRKSAEPAKTRLCAGVICCLVLGAGLDVQNLADGFIIAVMLFQLRLDGFKLLLVHRNQSFHNTHRFGMLNENALQPFQEIFNGSVLLCLVHVHKLCIGGKFEISHFVSSFLLASISCDYEFIGWTCDRPKNDAR